MVAGRTPDIARLFFTIRSEYMVNMAEISHDATLLVNNVDSIASKSISFTAKNTYGNTINTVSLDTPGSEANKTAFFSGWFGKAIIILLFAVCVLFVVGFSFRKYQKSEG
jgi:hypothetical protein